MPLKKVKFTIGKAASSRLSKIIDFKLHVPSLYRLRYRYEAEESVSIVYIFKSVWVDVSYP